MKNFVFPLLLLFLVSCADVDHEVEVSVANNSDADIREITFFTTNGKEKVWFDELKPNESASVTVDVKNYDADGNYRFEYTNSEGKKVGNTGNYLEEEFSEIYLDFIITNECISVKKRQIFTAQI